MLLYFLDPLQTEQILLLYLAWAVSQKNRPLPPAQLRGPEPEASGKVAAAHTVNRMGRPRQFFIAVALYFIPKMRYNRIQYHVNHVYLFGNLPPCFLQWSAACLQYVHSDLHFYQPIKLGKHGNHSLHLRISAELRVPELLKFRNDIPFLTAASLPFHELKQFMTLEPWLLFFLKLGPKAKAMQFMLQRQFWDPEPIAPNSIV